MSRREHFKCPWCNHRNCVSADDFDQDDTEGQFELTMSCANPKCGKSISVSGDYDLCFEIDDYQKLCEKCEEEIDDEGEDKGCMECGRCSSCCDCPEEEKAEEGEIDV